MAEGLRQRVLTALVLGGLVVLILLGLRPGYAVAAIVLVVLAGAWEWSAFAGFAAPLARSAYVLVMAAALYGGWLLSAEPAALQLMLRATMIWWLAALAWLLFAPAAGGRVAAAVAGVLVLVPAGVGLARLAVLVPDGRHLVLFLLVLTAAADVGAFFGGRRFGRHKLAPRVSPGKTWEGLAGGMLAAVTVAAVAAAPLAKPLLPWLALCIGVALSSVVGDLTESMFKRRAGLKDSGHLLPGHGGVLDRIDSLAAAAPVFLLGLALLGMLS